MNNVLLISTIAVLLLTIFVVYKQAQKKKEVEKKPNLPSYTTQKPIKVSAVAASRPISLSNKIQYE